MFEIEVVLVKELYSTILAKRYLFSCYSLRPILCTNQLLKKFSKYLNTVKLKIEEHSQHTQKSVSQVLAHYGAEINDM